MTAFNPATAYNEDWRFLDFIESVTWERTENGGIVQVPGFKARFGDFDTPEFQSLAAGLSLPSESAAVVLWEPKPSDVDLADWVPTFQPRSDEILRRESRGNEAWFIRGSTLSRFGHWLIAVSREPENG